MADLIGIKMMSKPKVGTTSGGGGTSRTYVSSVTEAESARYAQTAGKANKADRADRANYAERAGQADRATYADTAGRAETLTQYSELWGKFLRKDEEDTAQELVTFLKGLRSKHYQDNAGNEQNLLGSGFELVMQENGKSRLEVDELLVRMAAYFFKLDIREISYLGGDYIFSGAGSTIMEVVDLGDSWKCYLMTNDGTTATENHWQVNDQARCQTFDVKDGVTMGAKTKSYWRLVTATGEEPIPGRTHDDGTADENMFGYVVLSKTDCSGDSVPERGDKIVQMGNRTDESRQGLVYIRTQGVPAILIYTGIGGSYPYYSLDHITLQLSPEGNIIKGKLYSTATSSDGVSIDDMIRDLSQRLETVSAQADQKMDIWMYGHAPFPTKDNPSEANLPASDWTTDEQKALHVQDIFYDTSREAASRGGRTWRWIEDGGAYYWEEVTDQDTIAALEKIADVASDGILSAGTEKTRVLTEWLHAVSEYRQQSSSVTAYLQADYGKDMRVVWNDYKQAFASLGALLNGGDTYDTTALATPLWLQDLAHDTVIPSPDDYRSAWNTYYNALASLMQTISDTDKKRMDDLGEDSKLTPGEKLTLLKEWDNILAERASLQTQADAARVSRTAYDNAFQSVANMLNDGSTWQSGTPWLIDSSHISLTSDISFGTWSTTWAAFYKERTALLTAISASKVSVFVGSEPVPPYKVGDLWIRTDGQNVMTCIQPRSAGESYQASDWQDLGELTAIADPRMQLAALAEKLWKMEKTLVQGSKTVHVYFGVSPQSAVNGDVRIIDGTVSLYQNSRWTTSANTELTTMLTGLATVLGTADIALSYVARNGSMPSQPGKWDIALRNVTFYDTFKQQSVEGNIEVLLWNGETWELLREGTTAVMENLGDELRSIVFGANGDNEVDSSGLITQTKFNQLFSQKITLDADGNVANIQRSGVLTEADKAALYSEFTNKLGDVVTRAEISTFIKKENGYVESGVKMKADNIELEGVVTANGNFKIDTSGNMTAENATISGTVTATAGRFGQFLISGNGLTNSGDGSNSDGTFKNDAYIIMRNDNYKTFVGMGSNVLPVYSSTSAVARFENLDNTERGSDHMANLSPFTNTGAIFNVRGADTNIALALYGGCVAGMAYKTQIIGLNEVTSSTQPSTARTVAIERATVALYATTAYRWRAKSTDDYKVVTRDVRCTLPEMYEYDDGHMIKIKRGTNNGNDVFIIPGKSHYTTREADSSSPGGYKRVSHEGKTCILTDAGTYSTKQLELQSEMDAMELVYFRDLSVTITEDKVETTYHGVWVEFKHPRAW